MNPSNDCPSQQSGLFEDSNVLRHGGLRYRELGRKLSDGERSLGEAFDDTASSRIGKSAENTIEFATVNHKVI